MKNIHRIFLPPNQSMYSLRNIVILVFALCPQVFGGFEGRYATGGPHSCLSTQMKVTVAPESNNLPHSIRRGKGRNVAKGLISPYVELFGVPVSNSSTIWHLSLWNTTTEVHGGNHV
ncbi:hypothetical protein BDD12DRAFT_827809 [Trichophaea hybrida]|nr:hypothetical protein BDD12DRAFT_827809 [Trichophaea hybrida]